MIWLSDELRADDSKVLVNPEFILKIEPYGETGVARLTFITGDYLVCKTEKPADVYGLMLSTDPTHAIASILEARDFTRPSR